MWGNVDTHICPFKNLANENNRERDLSLLQQTLLWGSWEIKISSQLSGIYCRRSSFQNRTRPCVEKLGWHHVAVWQEKVSSQVTAPQTDVVSERVHFLSPAAEALGSDTSHPGHSLYTASLCSVDSTKSFSFSCTLCMLMLQERGEADPQETMILFAAINTAY